MPSNEGYINVVAVMQKFFDQGYQSGNWSYNPTHFENNEVPMSVMMQDLLNTYKYRLEDIVITKTLMIIKLIQVN